jgi:hypothetical protein
MNGIEAAPWRFKPNFKTIKRTEKGVEKEVQQFDPYSFKIGDTRSLGQYGACGVCFLRSAYPRLFFAAICSGWWDNDAIEEADIEAPPVAG